MPRFDAVKDGWAGCGGLWRVEVQWPPRSRSVKAAPRVQTGQCTSSKSDQPKYLADIMSILFKIIIINTYLKTLKTHFFHIF